MAVNGILLGQNFKDEQNTIISNCTIYIDNNTTKVSSIEPFKAAKAIPFYRAGDGGILSSGNTYYTSQGLYFIPDDQSRPTDDNTLYATIINPTNKTISFSSTNYVLDIVSQNNPTVFPFSNFKRIDFTGDSGYSSTTLYFILECIPTFLILYYSVYSTVWFHVGGLDFHGYNGRGPYNGKPDTKVELQNNLLKLTAPSKSGYPPVVNGGEGQGVILYC